MPDLVESLGGDGERERTVIAHLITQGDVDDWLRYLRERTDTVVKAIDTNGPGKDATRFAAILRDQYLLAQGVCDLMPADTESSARLEHLSGS